MSCHPDPLGCEDCHGPIHALVPSTTAASPINRDNAVGFCASCHREEEEESYYYSFHGSAYRLGSQKAPVCTDCHGHLSPVGGAGSAQAATGGPGGGGAAGPALTPVSGTVTAGAAEAAAAAGTAGDCAGCHRGGEAALASLVLQGGEHVTPRDREKGFPLWVVWKFFLAVILVNTAKDGSLIVLDLTHRLRSARGRRGDHAAPGRGARGRVSDDGTQ